MRKTIERLIFGASLSFAIYALSAYRNAYIELTRYLNGLERWASHCENVNHELAREIQSDRRGPALDFGYRP